jgi:hypothetical protein
MFQRIHAAAIGLGLFQSGSVLNGTCADRWLSRKRVISSTTELGSIVLSKSPLSVLWGFLGIRDKMCAWALWRLSPNAIIKGLDREWPSKVFLSCHHRRTLYEVDLCAQFLVSYFYKTFKVITDLKKPFAILGPLSTYFYNDTSINELSSDERHWAVARIMQDASDSTVISTFPDRCGSQFFGDQGMVFRPGLFAASLYTSVPIIDVTIVEPTESVDAIHIVFTEWTPPKIESKKCFNAEDYFAWRQEHNAEIKEFTLKCERDFKERLKSLEESKASCGVVEQECDNIKHVDDRVEKAMERNKNAQEYVFR